MATENLKITTIQTTLVWEDVDANLAHFQGLINTVADTDIIVLPEMFTTGFSMDAERLGKLSGKKATDWMLQISSAKNAAVLGSMITEDEGKYYNRLYVAFPDGCLQKYDKRHLFSLANEDKHYTAGIDKLIFEYKGWKICPLVCYDLRFPVWSRNRKTETGFDYDVLLYVANWPERRAYAWKALLPARAIENQSYVVGVNRIGDDGNGIYHSGDTVVYDFKADKLSATESGKESVETVELNRHDMEVFRRAYAFLSDADQFSIG